MSMAEPVAQPQSDPPSTATVLPSLEAELSASAFSSVPPPQNLGPSPENVVPTATAQLTVPQLKIASALQTAAALPAENTVALMTAIAPPTLTVGATPTTATVPTMSTLAVDTTDSAVPAIAAAPATIAVPTPRAISTEADPASTPTQDPSATTSTASLNQGKPENVPQSFPGSADAQSSVNPEPSDLVPVTALPNFFSLVIPPSDPEQISSQPPTQSRVPDPPPDPLKQNPSAPQRPSSELHVPAPNPIGLALDQQSQPPESIPLPETQLATRPSSFVIVPEPPVSLSGNASGKKGSNTSNNFFPPASLGSTLAAIAAPQPLAVPSALANAPQTETPDDTPDSLQRKGTTLVSPQTAISPTAQPQPAATALAGPTVQTSVQPPVQGMPSDLTPPTSAHKSENSAPPDCLDRTMKLASGGDSPVIPSPGPVQMAQMVSKASQSEMRIGMNTSAFGNVEVRTVVHANDVGVLIGSEKGDLRSFLANELPAIANTLQQQNLRLNQVNFHQHGFASSNQMSSGGDTHRRSFVPKPHVAGPMSSATLLVEFKEPTELPRSGTVGGISILA
jgi:hypothetical protein